MIATLGAPADLGSPGMDPVGTAVADAGARPGLPSLGRRSFASRLGCYLRKGRGEWGKKVKDQNC